MVRARIFSPLWALCALTPALAQTEAPPSWDDLEAAHPERVVRTELTRSGQDRPVELVRLGPGSGPAWLIVAGAEAGDRLGPELARSIAARLLRDHAELLETRTLYVLDRWNPDGAAAFAETPGLRGVVVPTDDDHDGRVDEDGPDDVDGDGRILTMRVPNPPRGTARTHLADPADPRLSRGGSPEHPPRFVEWVEGTDEDGDGLFGEDGVGQVIFDRNFPHAWPEFGEGAGVVPLCVPETRALARWLLDHREVVGVLVYGLHDTLVEVPVAGKTDATGRAPLGIVEGDAAVYRALSEQYRELTGRERGSSESRDGSLVAWAYAQLGIFGLSTPAWTRPELPEPAEADPENSGDSEEGETPGEEPKEQPADAEGAAWLALAEAWGEGFVPYREVEHPQLGRVEIGGFAPGLRQRVPAEARESWVAGQTAFVAALLEQTGGLVWEAPRVEALGPGVWRVTVGVEHEGVLPTLPAVAEQVRRRGANALELVGEGCLGGERVQGFVRLEAGQRFEAEWLVGGRGGETVTVRMVGPDLGAERLVEVELETSEEGR